MLYMMIMNTPRGTGGYQVERWPPNDLAAHIAFMRSFRNELMATGELIDAQGLTPPRDARIVRAGPDGAPLIDANFPDTKEFVAGFWVVDVPSEDRACALAARASAAPGPGGVPLNMPVELRRIASAPPTGA